MCRRRPNALNAAKQIIKGQRGDVRGRAVHDPLPPGERLRGGEAASGVAMRTGEARFPSDHQLVPDLPSLPLGLATRIRVQGQP